MDDLINRTDDLISRQALIEHLRRTIEATSTADGDYNEGFNDGMDFAACFASTLPSAQSERPTGHWEFQGDQMFTCTCCGYIASQEQLESWRIKETDSAFPLFCPNCGADMRGEKDE